MKQNWDKFDRDILPNMNISPDQYSLICRKIICYRRMYEREMPMCKQTEQLFRKTADDLLKMTNQCDSYPINLKKILEKAEISALPMDFSRLEEEMSKSGELTEGNFILGAFVSKDNKAAIFYRKEPDMGIHRHRFTIAHELAHACLTGQDNHIEFRFDSDPASIDENELAANIFAGELLIPEPQLEVVIKKLIIPTVSTLADIFEVSYNVMEARLKYLGKYDLVLS